MAYLKPPVPARTKGPKKIPQVAEIVRLVNETDQGCMPFQSLCVFFPNVKQTLLLETIRKAEMNFEVSSGFNTTVCVKTDLHICKTHIRKSSSGKNRTCDETCGGLHVCRTFLLCQPGTCPFNRGKSKCFFGHDMNTPHNKKLLAYHNLLGLDEKELRILFRRPASRNETTMPQICKYYNNPRNGCTKKKCRALHVCLNFLLGNCGDDTQCDYGRRHNLSSNNVVRVLDLFAIDLSSAEWTIVVFFQLMKSLMYDDSDSDSYSDYNSEASRSMTDLLDFPPETQYRPRPAASTPNLVVVSDDGDDFSLEERELPPRTTKLSPEHSYGDVSKGCVGCKANYKSLMALQNRVGVLEAELKDLKMFLPVLK
ncbi:uncharacterized protein LOC101848595 [Aplysia californica]|uniref:Uncharacterized protein LOC101848595 n=1 Tax=Aplysia californica TaxID=6500 RepID=A0ABM0JTK4_APLCA|nr:uncharacterized protein LOC101848595 [Aplysia californica]XP_035826362.1 uncharacterized protein LOC101848595 [Aplysia californica]